MRCSVQNCHSDTRKTSKSDGITFHLFPKDPIRRAAWIQALFPATWRPTERSTVCSQHFRDDDFYDTNSGFRRIKKDAVPVRVMESEEDADEPASLFVCRICLTMAGAMYGIREWRLDHQYEQVTGIFFAIEDRLPQRICWECAHRLRSAISFRNKAIRAHGLLVSMLDSNSCITIKNIKTINRTEHNLKSSLTKGEVFSHSIYNNNEESINNEEIIKSESDKEDNDNEYQNNCVDNGTEYNDNEHNDNEEGGKDDHVKVEVKDETTDEVFVEHLDDFGSDDDKGLSEIYPNIVKKEQGNLKKRRIVKKKENCGVKRTRDNSSLDKSKTNRRRTIIIDENLFTITCPTREEQIAEMEKRKESATYKNAPFKCTVCYKSFQIKDSYDAHLSKHSEAYGAFKCVICKTHHETSAMLWRHQYRTHKEKYSCKKCPFVTWNRGIAKKHAKWHSGTKYQCPHCPSTFGQHSTYMSHVRLRHVSDFVCELCGFTFISRKGVIQHQKLKHKGVDRNKEVTGPYCDLCDVKFVSEDAHSRHLQLSARHSSDNNPNRIRNEPKMRRGIPTRDIRERRPRGARGRRGAKVPLTCEQCGIQVKNFRSYTSHFNLHHPDKVRTKYPQYESACMCEQCGKIFPCMATLRDHTWVHTGEKLFKCSECPKSFSTRLGLSLHVKREHSATPPTAECGVCGKQFAYLANMTRHMAIHTGLKPHKCEMCGKCFRSLSEKRAHIDHVHLKKPWPRRAGRHRRTAAENTED